MFSDSDLGTALQALVRRERAEQQWRAAVNTMFNEMDRRERESMQRYVPDTAKLAGKGQGHE